MNIDEPKFLTLLRKIIEQWNLSSEGNNREVDQLVKTMKDQIITTFQDWKYANETLEGVMALYCLNVNIKKNWSIFQSDFKWFLKKDY